MARLYNVEIMGLFVPDLVLLVSDDMLCLLESESSIQRNQVFCDNHKEISVFSPKKPGF
ncbi:MAG: hypothetical protein F6J96_16145 [Symploca sp. SIO1C2]|nr:hypothetical protein [Symploca sp. SIO1C2]